MVASPILSMGPGSRNGSNGSCHRLGMLLNVSDRLLVSCSGSKKMSVASAFQPSSALPSNYQLRVRRMRTPSSPELSLLLPTTFSAAPAPYL